MGSGEGREGDGPRCLYAPFRLLCISCTLALPVTALSTHTGRNLRGRRRKKRKRGEEDKG